MLEIVVKMAYFAPGHHLRRTLSELQPIFRANEEFRLVVDPTGLTFISPTCLAALSAAIEWARRRPDFQGGDVLRPRAPQLERFLERVDFYSRFGARVEERFERRPPEGRFREMMRVEDGADGERVSAQLVEVLTTPEYGITLAKAEQSFLREMLWYALVEMMNNVFDHAQAPFGAITCAQTLPRSNAIEVCVVDCGIGIRRGLGRELQYRPLDTGEALLAAVKRGVTGRPQKHTGEGLYWLRRILEENGGKLRLASENRCLVGTRRSTRVLECAPWPGTIVGMRFDCGRPIEVGRLFGQATADELELSVEDLFVE